MGLTIAGGVSQLVGLCLVFAELAAIRAHEWGIVPPWTRLFSWLRSRPKWLRLRLRWLGSKLGRNKPVDVHVAAMSAAAVASGGTAATVTVGLMPLASDATDAQRFAWLEHNVRVLLEQVSVLRRVIGEERDVTNTQLEGIAAGLRAEAETREQQRRARLRWSVRRQALGTVCVVVGVVLTTVGAVA